MIINCTTRKRNEVMKLIHMDSYKFVNSTLDDITDGLKIISN